MGGTWFWRRFPSLTLSLSSVAKASGHLTCCFSLSSLSLSFFAFGMYVMHTHTHPCIYIYIYLHMLMYKKIQALRFLRSHLPGHSKLGFLGLDLAHGASSEMGAYHRSS
jgi:hypothetical protein